MSRKSVENSLPDLPLFAYGWLGLGFKRLMDKDRFPGASKLDAYVPAFIGTPSDHPHRFNFSISRAELEARVTRLGFDKELKAATNPKII